MVQHFSSNLVFPVASDPIKNGVVSVDASGKILFVGSTEEAKQRGITGIQFKEGAIVPGFVNAHCHLELSHMLNQIPKHTGLVPFLKNIMTYRAAKEDSILAAAASADAYMYQNGIVAVGDISNNSLTYHIKKASKIAYHTFVEVLGVRPEAASGALERAQKVFDQFGCLSKSLVPHAPYSVSRELFNLLHDVSDSKSIFSIHNQESDDENKLFLENSGSFLDLYNFLGVDFQDRSQGLRSIQVYLKYLKKQRTVLVHNTFSTIEDVEYAQKNHDDLYWCLCPNANLYIENSLPDVRMLQKSGANIVVGTDSLASNSQLSVLAELSVLQSSLKLSFREILPWATINGASLLGLSSTYGSLEVGKTPGICLVALDQDENILNNKVSRLN